MTAMTRAYVEHSYLGIGRSLTILRELGPVNKPFKRQGKTINIRRIQRKDMIRVKEPESRREPKRLYI